MRASDCVKKGKQIIPRNATTEASASASIGSRFPLKNLSVMYSMEMYQIHPSIDDIYVVCVKGWENIVRDYDSQYGITKLRDVIVGGNSGTASLKNAIDHLKGHILPKDYVIIQEATRPMVTIETISKLLQACLEKGSATICYSMKEYVQFSLVENKAEYVDRNTLIALQSPEAHRFSLLCEVFEQIDSPLELTESCCTMFLYKMGYPINFIESNVNNIKIIREEDIAIFHAMKRN